MSESLTRSFICLPLPDEMKSALGPWVTGLKAENPCLRWVRPDQYHITLKFCGGLTRGQIDALTENMGRELEKSGPGKILLAPALPGAFPSLRSARVFFLGIGGETKKIENMAAVAETAAAAAGIPEETRAFRPHVTLARAKNPCPVKTLPFGEDPAQVWRAEKIQFLKSELGPRGPVYTTIREWILE